MKHEERIQKLISNYGTLSRRQADRLVEEGKVKVNGQVVKPGAKATINDKVEIDGKQIKFNLKHEYYLLNKPKGYICRRVDDRLTDDEANSKNYAVSLINNYKDRNLFTIGRLDVQTTGLIIVTSDGELSNIVNSPRFKVPKTYLVWVDKKLSKDMILGLQLGTKLDDGYVTKKVKKFKVIHNNDEKVMIKMTITEGKKNQIRRMFKAYDRRVINLKRIQIGNHLLEGIDNGQYKKLSQQEMLNGLGVVK